MVSFVSNIIKIAVYPRKKALVPHQIGHNTLCMSSLICDSMVTVSICRKSVHYIQILIKYNVMPYVHNR